MTLTTHEHDEARGKSFFQDPQRLTFTLGLTSGLAVMAIVGFIIVSVKGDSGSTLAGGKGGGSDALAADTGGSNAGPTAGNDAAQWDPVAFATSVGIDENKFKNCLNDGKYADRVKKDEDGGNAAGVDGTPATFVNGTKISGAYPYETVKAAIDAALNGTKGPASIPEVTKDDHATGAKKPKVYLVEYSDYQCPYCKKHHPTMKQVLQEYGDKVAWVYRHFPLDNLHPYARKLAEGAECAAELGGNDKFWEYTYKIFES